MDNDVTIEEFLWSAFHTNPPSLSGSTDELGAHIFDTVPEEQNLDFLVDPSNIMGSLDVMNNNLNNTNCGQSSTNAAGFADPMFLASFLQDQNQQQQQQHTMLMNAVPEPSLLDGDLLFNSTQNSIPQSLDNAFGINEMPLKTQLPLPPMPKKKAPQQQRSLEQEIEALNFDDVTVTQLKTLLRRCGLSASGKKTELIDKLKKELMNMKASKKQKAFKQATRQFGINEPFQNVGLYNVPLHQFIQ